MTVFASRRARLLDKLHLERGESFLVTNVFNVYYLTGFTGSSGWLLVTADKPFMISDSRYRTQLSEECSDLECVIRDSASTALESLASTVGSAKIQTIRIEADSMTKATYDGIDAELVGVELVSTSAIVEELRSFKDESEIALIRRSIDVNQQAFLAVRAQLRPEQTERSVAFQLEHEMRERGATGVSFDPIVGVGPRAALPHGHPSLQTIGADPILLIDWGARVDRYISDLTRILVTGKIPPKLREIYDIVLEAQLAAIAAIHPGAEIKAVDAAARKVIEGAGFKEFFGHATGHGIGLQVHENPNISPIRDGVLAASMVVTVEPGIYLPDFGGVRIEDDILVTESGREVLSTLTKDLDECVVEF